MELSHAHFSALPGAWTASIGARTTSLPANLLRTANRSMPRVGRVFPGRRVLAPDEHPFPHRYVLTYQSLFIEPPAYLKALWNAFTAAGGRMRQQEVRSIEELMTLDVPLIANCTGLGARDLFGDTGWCPCADKSCSWARRAHRFQHARRRRRALYMFPRRDGILLGGSFERVGPRSAKRMLR